MAGSSSNTFSLYSGDESGEAGDNPLSGAVDELASSGTLAAALFFTYSFDLPLFKRKFPMLLESAIPCLIVHGDKCVGEPTKEDGSAYQGSGNWTLRRTVRATCAYRKIRKRKRGGQSYDSDSDSDSASGTKSCTCCANFRQWTCKANPEWISVAKIFQGKGSVHHSKGALLFTCAAESVDAGGIRVPRERRITGLRVVIMTGNMTPKRTGGILNGAWHQDFALKTSHSAQAGSDFEDVIANYFHRLEQAAAGSDGFSPLASFFSRMRSSSGQAFQSALDTLGSFDFAGASVSLIASIPGTYPASCSEYGHKRVRKCLEAANTQSRWTDRDSIAIHMTSLGMGLDGTYYFGEFLPSLKGSSSPQDVVIWPTNAFVKETGKPACHFASAGAWQDMGMDGMLSRSFHMYESPSKMLAHMKVYARVIGGDGDHLQLGWLWLTSANLSRGAQGFIDERGDFAVRNWELGVLFVPEGNSRLFAAEPSGLMSSYSSCNIENSDTFFPVPFHLAPAPFRDPGGSWPRERKPYVSNGSLFGNRSDSAPRGSLPWDDDSDNSSDDDDDGFGFVVVEGV